ncbi:MAG: sigma-70 family RNA polymerase sigma factor [Phycisphaerales bacterium]|nr:sigma-70 family RNA polymerase sigma factor [Phycisphaerales bacterium]
MRKTLLKPRISVKRVVAEPLSLLQRIGAGDTSAMVACMERFRGLIWSLVRRSCSNAADAEDVVQEIFTSLWRSAHRFDPTIASESTFVSVIARRRLIDRTRQRMRRPAPGSIIQDVKFDRDELPRCQIKEASAIAQVAMEKLRPEQRQVLQLSIEFGCSHEQIATSTGLPLGTVKTHARRGLQKLRDALIESGIDIDPIESV